MLPGLERHFRQTNPGPVQFLLTRRKKHAIDLALESAENGCDYMIAVGGDGTLHEVINGLLQSSLPAHEYPIIGLLPCGSANDFARTAHVSDSMEDLVHLIETHTAQKIDLGQIVLEQTGEVRYFINIAGAGLGGEVVQKMEQSSGMLGPGLNYFRHIFTGFLRYIKKEVTLYRRELAVAGAGSCKWPWLMGVALAMPSALPRMPGLPMDCFRSLYSGI